MKVPGDVLLDQVVEPREFLACEAKRGETVRIVDLEGQQVVGLTCFNLDKLDETLSLPNSIGLNGRIDATTGYKLYSDEAGLMMTITADTCGRHSMVAGACSSFMNKLRYGLEHTRNCRDNFAMAIEPWGLGWKDVAYPINVFMSSAIGPDGSYSIELPTSKAGDYTDFTADMSLLVAISNCPQDKNKVNAFKLKPVRIIHFRPAAGDQS